MITKQDHDEAAAFVAANPPAPRFTVHRSDRGGFFEIWERGGGRRCVFDQKADAEYHCLKLNLATSARGRWDR